jgi:uncharacterized protein (TIGR02246 family)
MATFIAVVLAALLLLAPTAAFAGPAEEAGSVIERWMAAFSANDADAVVKLYSTDATLLGTAARGVFGEGAAAVKAYFASLPGSGSKVMIDERRLVVLADNVVLGTGLYTFTIVRDGVPTPNPARFSMVVVKRGAEWLIAHHHSSQRPRPPR